MKKLLSFAAVCSLLLSFTACSDNDSVNDGPDVEAQDQYLVMFYGVGGSNLDDGIVGNILQSLNAGSSDKVKMTYQYRFSKSFEDSADVYHDILRFTADENTQLVGNVNIDSTIYGQYVLPTFKRNIKTTHFGNQSYIMSSDTALTSFIKWSKAMYPDAKKTILIVNNHGGGWQMLRDGITDAAGTSSAKTRTILIDDNTWDSEGYYHFLSTLQLMRAISNAGNVDLLYTDACLMSTWENLTAYSECTSYFIGSLELAPSIGGNYDFLINRLKEADITDDGLKSAAENYVNDVIDKWWEKRNEDFKAKNYSFRIYGDLAAYDLRKISTPLAVFSDIRKTLVEKYNDDTDIPGIKDSYIEKKWRDYINEAISETVVASSHVGGYVSMDKVPAPMLVILDSLWFSKYNITHEGYYYYSGDDVLAALQLTDLSTILSPEYIEQYKALWTVLSNRTTDSYPLSQYMVTLRSLLNDAGVSDQTLADLNDRYIKALRDMGLVRCTQPVDCTYPCAYQLCSPGCFIFPLNEAAYTNENNFSARYSDHIPTAAEALSIYHATAFDHVTQWSDFLKLIEVAPSVITNPTRQELK